MRRFLLILTLITAALEPPSPAQGESYAELFMGLSRPPVDFGTDPKPGPDPEATALALYSDEVFFRLRNEFPESVTDYLAPCFSQDLRAHFHRSRGEIARWLAEHASHDLKLPMGEGSIFLGAYDGATWFKVGAVSISGERAAVRVHLSYCEFPYPPYDWTDHAQLINVGGVWLLDDISYDEYGDEYTLRGRTRIAR